MLLLRGGNTKSVFVDEKSVHLAWTIYVVPAMSSHSLPALLSHIKTPEVYNLPSDQGSTK